MTTEQRELLADLAAHHRTYEDDAAAILAALDEIERLTTALRQIADNYDPSCHGTAEMENHESAIDALEGRL